MIELTKNYKIDKKHDSKSSIEKFTIWLEEVLPNQEHTKRSDSYFRLLEYRKNLHKSAVADACRMTRSEVYQNKQVVPAFNKLQDELRARGVLPPRSGSSKPSTNNTETDKTQEYTDIYTRDLERKTVELSAENRSLKADKAILEAELNKLKVLHRALSDTGRLPR